MNDIIKEKAAERNEVLVETFPERGQYEYPTISTFIAALKEAMEKYGDIPIIISGDSVYTDEINLIELISNNGKSYAGITYDDLHARYGIKKESN